MLMLPLKENVVFGLGTFWGNLACLEKTKPKKKETRQSEPKALTCLHPVGVAEKS